MRETFSHASNEDLRRATISPQSCRERERRQEKSILDEVNLETIKVPLVKKSPFDLGLFENIMTFQCQ